MLGVSCGLPWLQQFWAHLSAAYALLTFCVCCNTFSGSLAVHLQRMPVFCCPAFMRCVWPGCNTAHSAHMDLDIVLPISQGACILAFLCTATCWSHGCGSAAILRKGAELDACDRLSGCSR